MHRDHAPPSSHPQAPQQLQQPQRLCSSQQDRRGGACRRRHQRSRLVWSGCSSRRRRRPKQAARRRPNRRPQTVRERPQRALLPGLHRRHWATFVRQAAAASAAHPATAGARLAEAMPQVPSMAEQRAHVCSTTGSSRMPCSFSNVVYVLARMQWQQQGRQLAT